MTNHPTQGLQDMTLDLSTYSDTGLKELQTRIAEEKTKRERKVPFEVFPQGGGGILLRRPLSNSVWHNLYHRLSAEAKLRAAGGGGFDGKSGRIHLLWKYEREDEIRAFSASNPYQGVLYFNSCEQALSAYATLTPDEQAAIFGFGEG